MNNILIHCAMEKEADKLVKKLNLKEKVNENIEKVYEGKIENTILDLIITGIGKQKTAIGVTKYLCENKKPDYIINIGYAGSTNLEIGKWISISQSYNLEWEILGEEKYNMLGINNKLEVIKELESLPCYSAEKFVTKTDIKDSVLFDMELYSLTLISNIYNIKLISLKKVSDNLNMDDYYKNIKKENVMELESSLKYIQKYII